jgi:hypothetical protein
MLTQGVFHVNQLMTILDEDRHSLILVEHDPMLYEDASEMTENVSEALQQAAQEAAVLLFLWGSLQSIAAPGRFENDLGYSAKC